MDNSSNYALFFEVIRIFCLKYGDMILNSNGTVTEIYNVKGIRGEGVIPDDMCIVEGREYGPNGERNVVYHAPSAVKVQVFDYLPLG